jgi:cystathionine gamma-synthase/methionine-gamma-lyase
MGGKQLPPQQSKSGFVGDPGLDIATRLVHAGERAGLLTAVPVSTPIYASVTYTYGSMAEVDKVFGGEMPGYVYSRYANPTLTALESAMHALEGGFAASAFGSGMAALHAALLACDIGSGCTVLASQDLYGATIGLLNTVFTPFAVNTIMADYSDLEELERKAPEMRPRIMIAETISNPLLKVCDLERCAEIAHAIGAKLIVDNTFATPYLCRPLELGADIVVHSATKYLGGHGDVMGGIVVAREEPQHNALRSVMKLAGGIMSPYDAHEILRGLKTLALRVERQCANAHAIAEKLSADRRVARVHYPGLATSDGGRKLERTLRPKYAGAMVAIELANNTKEGAFRFMDALRLVVRSTSLGDVFTSALHPATASHRDVPPARRRALGITDGLVRLSIGIEHVDDILADIGQALDASVA